MELQAYLTPLRKWWWLMLASAVIAAVTSYLAVSQQPPVYRAHSTLLIGSAINNPNPSGNEFWLSQQLAQTYTDISQREVVQDAVKKALGLTWLPAYTTRTVPNTQLIEIIVTDSNPERTMVVANELANQLVLLAPTSSAGLGDAERQAFIRQQLDDLEIKIEETKSEILAKQTELAGLFSARQIADAESQVRALEGKLNTLQGNYASLLASSSQGAVNSLSVIEPATLPQYPIESEAMMTVLTAAAIGFSLAIAAAYLLEYLDDTIKTSEDVLSVGKLPTLSGIANFKTENGTPNELVTLTQPRSPISEAFRTLRTSVLFTNVDNPIRTLLITSSNPAEGKSLTSANLGVVLAQAGHRVLLIDADLRRPKQHHIFGVPMNYGLTNLLVQMNGALEQTKMVELLVNVNKVVRETKQPGLFLLTTGSVPPNPAEIIGSAKMKTLLGILSTRFDYVILDSPPALAVTDAVILSTRVDTVLLVTNAGKTRRNQLRQATNRLREVQANLAGVVLNRLTADSGDYYYYAYYKNGYYLDDLEGGKAKPAQPTGSVENDQSNGKGVKKGLLPHFFTRLLG